MEKEVCKEVKKEVKKTNFYLTIFNLIKQGKRPSEIQSILKITKQNIQYYINYLKNNGFIKKIGYGTWEVKKEVKKSSLGVRDKPTTELHALQIKFPILKGKINDKDWQIKNKLKNWIPRYKTLRNLGGLTIRNNNNKSLTIFAKARDIESLEEVDNLAFKIRLFIGKFFQSQGVKLDIFNCEVKNIDLETENKDIEKATRRKEKFVLDLNKKSEKIFEKDNINAKAWIDPTPKPFSVGTNDKEWKREYLSMPFRIRDSFGILEATLKTLQIQTEHTKYLAENIRSHIPAWVNGAKDTKNVLKILKKIDNRLSQTLLLKWL